MKAAKLRRARRDGRVSAGTRPSRNDVIARTCRLARGRVEMNMAQGKHFVASLWDVVLGSMLADDVFAYVSAELRSAARRLRDRHPA